MTKLAVFLVPLVVLAAVPWLILTRFVHTSPNPKPTAAISVSHTPSPSPSKSTSAAKGSYEVSNLTGAGSCLRIHSEPGTSTPVIDCLQAGVVLSSDGQTADADGRAWLHVHDSYKKKDGWAAGSYLKKVG